MMPRDGDRQCDFRSGGGRSDLQTPSFSVTEAEAAPYVSQAVGAVWWTRRRETRPGAKLVARRGLDYYLLDLDDVYALQADGEIVRILTARRKYRAVHSLGRLEERLRGTQFQRVHRSVLVNTNRIRRLSTLSSRRWLLTLTNGLEFIVSKRRAPLVRNLLL